MCRGHRAIKSFTILAFLLISSLAFGFRGFDQKASLRDSTSDPDWDRVVLLLRCEGGTIVDQRGHSFTNTSVSNSMLQSKFGLESCYFNGASVLDFATSADFAMGTGDFTVEGWVNTATNNTSGTFVASSSRFAAGVKGFAVQDSSSLIGNQQNPYEQIYPFSTAYTTFTWQHFAFVRNGGTITHYINGLNVGSVSASINLDSTHLVMGQIAFDQANYFMTGYMDEVRITKGLARYTANFSPPIGPFPTTVSPGDLSGLSLWLDASDGTTITESLGAISEWRDKSSNALSFTQSAANNKPTLDTGHSLFPKDCIDFNVGAANKFLNSTTDLSLVTNHTIFVVGHWTDNGGYRSFGVVGGTSATSVQGANNTGYAITFSSPGYPANFQMMQDNTGAVIYYYTSIPSSSYLATYLSMGTNTYPAIRHNRAALVPDGTAATVSTFVINTLGSTDALYLSHGSIGEIIIYNRTLSAEEVMDVETYLQRKWNTP